MEKEIGRLSQSIDSLGIARCLWLSKLFLVCGLLRRAGSGSCSSLVVVYNILPFFRTFRICLPFLELSCLLRLWVGVALQVQPPFWRLVCLYFLSPHSAAFVAGWVALATVAALGCGGLVFFPCMLFSALAARWIIYTILHYMVVFIAFKALLDFKLFFFRGLVSKLLVAPCYALI